MSIIKKGGPRHWYMLGRGKVMAKSEDKRLLGRYLLNATREYTKAAKRRDGSIGAASKVRHVYNRDRDGPL